MRPTYRTLAAAFVLALFGAACGGDAAESAAETAADALRDAADRMEQTAENLRESGDDDSGDVMDSEALQDRLPEELAGLHRISSERQSMGAGGLNMSTAEAVYENDDGQRVEVTLMTGAGILMGPAMAFNMVDFERTTASGFERTVTLHGFKGMQTYEESGGQRDASISLLVDDRVLIQLDAEGMTMEELEEVLEELDPESMD